MEAAPDFSLETISKLRARKNKVVKTVTETSKTLVNDASKRMSSDPRVQFAKKVIDILPDATSEQQEERRKNREKMTGTLFLPNQRPKPNTSELTDEEIGKAQIVKAGSILHDSDALSAQEYLDSNMTTRGWKIDPRLSNADHIVVYKNGDVKVAFRGTKWLTRNWKADLETNVANLADEDMTAPQNMSGREVIRQIEAKYGKVPSELLGYSKGGGTVLTLGDLTGIETTVFNPSIGPRQMRTASSVPHRVIMTVDDPVSVMSYFKPKSNYTLKRIRSIRGENPIAQHKLSNFTQRGTNQANGLEKMSHELIGKGQNLGHVETYDSMRQGVEQKRTFTETLDDFISEFHLFSYGCVFFLRNQKSVESTTIRTRLRFLGMHV